MPNSCPECGAVLSKDSSCQTIFDSFLVLEFTVPGYGDVHFLTVACFMIQHGRYSDEALIWVEKRLRANLEDGISAEQIRKQASNETDQSNRTWKITRQPGALFLPKIAWSMTIANIASSYLDSKSYCDLVKQLARSLLAEMKPLLPYSLEAN